VGLQEAALKIGNIVPVALSRPNATAPPVSDTNSARDHAILIRQLNRRFGSRCSFQELSQVIFHSAQNHEHSQWLDDLLSAETCTYPAGTLN
jgi:hypothetical protein